MGKSKNLPRGIYRRSGSDKLWIRFAGPNGEIIRESTGSSRVSDAERLLTRRRNEVWEDKFFPNNKKNNPSLSELEQQYFKIQDRLKKNRQKGWPSRKDDVARFKNIMDFYGPKLKVKQITSDKIEALKKFLLEEKHKRNENGLRRGLKPATVNRHITLLKRAFKLVCPHLNPFTVDSMLKEDNVNREMITQEEYEQLLEAADSELGCIMAFGYLYGFRANECVMLRWEWIDKRLKIISIPSQATKNNKPKVVPLLQEIQQHLDRLAQRKSGRVFSYDSSMWIGKKFTRLAQKVLGKKKTFHMFRKSAATNLRRAGVPGIEIAKICGWTSTAMLEKRYSIINSDDMVSAFEKLGKKTVQ